MAAPPAMECAAFHALDGGNRHLHDHRHHGGGDLPPRFWRLAMPMILASFVCGLIFGAGLLISGMTQPEKVLGFLDIFGAWDATLAFVMAGAVAVSAVGFALARRSAAPVFAPRF